MCENKNNTPFNVGPLMVDVENLIKSGIDTILKDFINRYDLLENTHKQIMMLPSVMSELKNNNINNNESKETFLTVATVNNPFETKISEVEKRMGKIETNFANIIEMLNKLVQVQTEKTIVEPDCDRFRALARGKDLLKVILGSNSGGLSGHNLR